MARVLVVGGGAAGVAAAVGARRGGAEVIVVERYGFLGGMATAAEVGTICGLFTRDLDGPPRWAVGGLAREIGERVARRSRTAPVRWKDGLAFLPYHPPDFARVCDEVTGDVDLRLHTTLAALTHAVEGPRWRATLHAWDRVCAVEVDAVVDASGVAWAAAAAARPLDEDAVPQAPALVFTVAGLPDLDPDALRLFLLKELTRAARDGALPATARGLSVVPGWPIGGTALMKLGIATAVRDDPADVTRLERHARAVVDAIGQWLPGLPGLERARVVAVAPQLGLRTGRRPRGTARLTDADVLGCRRAPDGVAVGAWPAERWTIANQPVLEHLPLGATYEISASILDGGDGLWFAGRCLPATDRAIASARVIGTCLATGYASGRLAAAAARGEDLGAVIRQIREEQVVERAS